jgi:hypothetical protein
MIKTTRQTNARFKHLIEAMFEQLHIETALRPPRRLMLGYTPPEHRAIYLSFPAYLQLVRALEVAMYEAGSFGGGTFDLPLGYKATVRIRAPRQKRRAA